MPKLTFFNLPEDKKHTLIQAMKKEFSRVPLYEASIANIVKAAGIPRGSFYQYFEDKEDAFFFLLNAVSKERKYHFISTLEGYKGDIFEAMIDLFKLMIQEEENALFLKNVFLNMTYRIENTFSKIISDQNSTRGLGEIQELIDKDLLNISDEKELSHAVKIITSVTLRNFIEKFAKDLSAEEALENYLIEMKLLKNGLLRK